MQDASRIDLQQLLQPFKVQLEMGLITTTEYAMMCRDVMCDAGLISPIQTRCLAVVAKHQTFDILCALILLLVGLRTLVVQSPIRRR